MRLGGRITLAVLVLLAATAVLAGARHCDMELGPGGMTVRVRATGEDITKMAGAYARSCLGRAFFTGDVQPGMMCQNRTERLRAALDI